jgi:hypothetical protein
VASILAYSLLTWAAGSWTPASTGGGATQKDVSCGNIIGVAGSLWGEWDDTPTATTIFSHTDLGGEWDGSEYPAKTAPTQNVPDTHYHRWEKVNDGTPGDNTIQVQTQVSTITEGTAGQLNANDPQWWWIPSVVYIDGGVSVAAQNPGSEEYTDFAWGEIHENSPATYTSENSAQGGAPQATSSSHGGEFRGSATMPPSAGGRSIRVNFKWTVVASAASDNANVDEWKEGVHYDALSAITGADVEDDFDYWE